MFEADDWKIKLTLFKTDVVGERAIAYASGGARWATADLEIRQALEEKASAYGVLGAPYLIVVADCKGELAGGDSNDDALLEALFGTVAVGVTMLSSGECLVRKKRRADGFWGHPQAPRHQNVSGVLLLPLPDLWALRSDRWQPLLLRNPWAEHPVSEAILPLPGYRLTEKDEFAPVEGTRLADILGLPAVWPPTKAES